MAFRRFPIRQGALHLLVLLALTACGNTDPPSFGGGDVEPTVRIPRTLSFEIAPAGPHALLTNEGFGRSVAISGARIAVADYLDWQVFSMKFPHVDTYEIVDGAPVWTGKLPAVGYGELCFGETLALSGDLLVIGEPCANAGAGEVHVYRRDASGWVEEPTLTSQDAASSPRFGAAITLAANRMVVGSPLETGTGADGTPLPRAGAAYVYGRTGGAWRLTARLTPADAQGGDGFGGAVAMTAAVIAVTSPSHPNVDVDGNAATGGRAHVFALQPDGTWLETAVLEVTDGQPDEWTGFRVALCTETLFVAGDHWLVPTVHGFGRTAAGWIEQDLVDSTVAPNGFPDAMVCDGDLLAVGRPYASPPEEPWLGSARFYKKVVGGMTLVAEVTGAAENDRAGHAVALDNGVAVVGIPGAVVGTRSLGIVKVLRF